MPNLVALATRAGAEIASMKNLGEVEALPLSSRGEYNP